MTTPRTAAGRSPAWEALYEEFRRSHGTAHWSTILTRHRHVIEAEARAAALDRAERAVQDTRRRLTMGPSQDATDVHIAWALGEALAAIDALRERSGEG